MIIWVDTDIHHNSYDNLIRLFSYLRDKEYFTKFKHIPVTLPYCIEYKLMDPYYANGMLVDTNEKTMKWCNFEITSSIDVEIDCLCHDIDDFLKTVRPEEKVKKEIIIGGHKYRLIEE